MTVTNNAIDLTSQGTCYYNGTGTFSGLDGISPAYVLTSNGTGVAPSFQPVPFVTTGGGFFAFNNINFGNVTGDGTTYTIPYNTLIFDTLAGFDITTGIFTVPPGGAGIYTFQAVAVVDVPVGSGIAMGTAFGGTGVALGGTSNLPTRNQVTDFAGLNGWIILNGAITLNLSVGNTVWFDITCTGGSKTTNIIQGSYFCGCLVSSLASVTNFKINTIVFPSNGTYTPSMNMKYCIVEVVGGGGGGGGTSSTAAGQSSVGAGGGAGGYARKTLSAATIGAFQTVSIGAGGSAGTVGGGDGGTGATTSFGTIFSATGGGGGKGTVGAGTTAIAGGGGGGNGINGDFSTFGSAGTTGFGVNSFVFSGEGGSSFFGGGARAETAIGSAAAGLNGSSYGGGGSGAISAGGGTQQAGGAGASGIVVVTEYLF